MQNSVLPYVRTSISRIFDIDPQQLRPDTDLQLDLGADSLDRLEVAMQLEREFGIRISDADALAISTVHDAAEVVDRSARAERECV